MQILSTPLTDVKLLRPQQFGDERGWFAEVFNAKRFAEAGLPVEFVQDNQSCSQRGVLRGLHYQVVQPQGKLVRCLSGTIWDVAVDLRRGSPTFGKWHGFLLEADSLELIWIPEGFAHGFLVLSEMATVLYKTTNFYHPSGERCVLWNDAELAIDWPVGEIGTPILSPKDLQGASLQMAELPAPFQRKTT